MKQPEETRSVEFKFTEDAEAGTITGIASVWDEPDQLGDIVRKGAFKRSLAEHKANGTKPLFRYEHRSDALIGVWDNIIETDKGLEVKGRIVITTAKGAEAHELLKAGALNGLSIGFRTRAAEKAANGARLVTDVDLVEISLVALPAAMKARVHSIKSEDGATDTDNKIERFIGALKLTTKTMEKRA